MGVQSAASAPVAAATSEEDASGCSLAEEVLRRTRWGIPLVAMPARAKRRKASRRRSSPTLETTVSTAVTVLFFSRQCRTREANTIIRGVGPWALMSCAPDQSIAQQRLRPPLSKPQSGMANPSLESGALQAPTPAVEANPAGEAPNLTICVLSSPVRSRRSWPTWA